jgi:hypothetical protein
MQVKASHPLAEELFYTQWLLCILLNPGVWFDVVADLPGSEVDAIEQVLKSEQADILKLIELV